MAYTIGLDIGGTTIKAGLFREDSELAETIRVRTYGRINSRDEILSGIAGAITQIQQLGLSKGYGELTGIGIGVPGFVNRLTGEILASANLALKGVNLQTWVQDRVGVLCVIQGDAKLGALAESVQGAGRDVSGLLYVSLGTGVGGGVVVGGRVYEGDHLLAGEIGHAVVDPDGALCGCGKRGCLETVASGPAIANAYRKQVEVSKGVSAADVSSWATVGDRVARAVYQEAAHTLAFVLVNYVTVLDPSLIVVGGGVSLAGPVLFTPLMEGFARYSSPRRAAMVHIVPAKLGDTAGMVGAHILVREALE